MTISHDFKTARTGIGPNLAGRKGSIFESKAPFVLLQSEFIAQIQLVGLNLHFYSFLFLKLVFHIFPLILQFHQLHVHLIRL